MEFGIYVGKDETFLQFGKLYEILEIDNLCFVRNEDSYSYLIFTSDDFMDLDSWRIYQLQKITLNETENLDFNK
jgi:hypothetical protein